MPTIRRFRWGLRRTRVFNSKPRYFGEFRRFHPFRYRKAHKAKITSMMRIIKEAGRGWRGLCGGKASERSERGFERGLEAGLVSSLAAIFLAREAIERRSPPDPLGFGFESGLEAGLVRSLAAIFLAREAIERRSPPDPLGFGFERGLEAGFVRSLAAIFLAREAIERRSPPDPLGFGFGFGCTRPRARRAAFDPWPCRRRSPEIATEAAAFDALAAEIGR